MRELTEAEVELRTKRRKAFRSFVGDSKPAIMEFAEFLGVENPQTAVEQPEKFLKVLEAFLKVEDISELEQKDREWLHLRLMYFIGQLLLYRYGGIWFLNENPEAKSFLRYVVGYFERGSVPKNLSVDPFSVVEDFLVEPPERSLLSTIKKVEEEMGLQDNREL
jgi:hypothetical protein